MATNPYGLGNALTGLGIAGNLFSEQLQQRSLLDPGRAANAINPNYISRISMGLVFSQHARRVLVHPGDVNMQIDRNVLTDHLCYGVRVLLAIPHGTVVDPMTGDNRVRFTLQNRTKAFSISREFCEDNRNNPDVLIARIKNLVTASVDQLREEFEHDYNPPLTFQDSRKYVRAAAENRIWEDRRIDDPHTAFQRQAEYFYSERQLAMQQQGRELDTRMMSQAQAEMARQAEAQYNSAMAQAFGMTDIMARFNETWGRFTPRSTHPGEKKAIETLAELIGEDQAEIYKKTGHLFVAGRMFDYIIPRQGMVYRVRKSIRKDGAMMEHARRLCVAIEKKLDFPPTDNVIALKLMIEHHERKFLRKANRFERTSIKGIEAACLPQGA